MPGRALILVNVGTPESPSVKDVRKYLSAFLNDPMVIDIPWLLRKILVNLVIVPFRAPRSARLYKKLWTKEGSPLRVHLENLCKETEMTLQGRRDNSSGLSGALPQEMTVIGAMRYGNPSLESVLQRVCNEGFNEITVLPLYPQYASSTTGSVIELLHRFSESVARKPGISIVKKFYRTKAYINSLAGLIKTMQPEQFDHIIFSYHGLPVRHLRKENPLCDPETCDCHLISSSRRNSCYRSACYETSMLIAEALGLDAGAYSTTFQSRLTSHWLRPFTDETLVVLAQSGMKRVLVATPSFVAECLETIIEVGVEYRKLFVSHGGREMTLVPCLNETLDIPGIIDEWRTGQLTLKIPD